MEKDILDELIKKERVAMVLDSAEHLTWKQNKVIKLKLSGWKTRELAKLLGVCQCRIHQIENTAIRKIKEAIVRKEFRL